MVSVATRLRAENAGIEFGSGRVRVPYFFSKMPRLALQRTQLHIQWVPSRLFRRQSGLKREVDQSPPCSVDVKNK